MYATFLPVTVSTFSTLSAAGTEHTSLETLIVTGQTYDIVVSTWTLLATLQLFYQAEVYLTDTDQLFTSWLTEGEVRPYRTEPGKELL